MTGRVFEDLGPEDTDGNDGTVFYCIFTGLGETTVCVMLIRHRISIACLSIHGKCQEILGVQIIVLSRLIPLHRVQSCISIP